ncbi:MAG: adenosylcobinamide-GDP ribazoletransferase [Chromatiales bacterium]|nr:adenosylcobinamide-GDP ribazoletransferase [Chromatiales bacterium]
MRPFWIALQFLTRLPTPSLTSVTPVESGRSLLFYPLVGLLIGVLLYFVSLLTTYLSPLLTAAVVVALWLWLTGALHVDGLADMADGWVGGQGDRERTLAIMRDPYCGPMGVSAVVALLLLKFAALTVVVTTSPLWLLYAPLAARGMVLLLMLTTPYCREQGLASAMLASMPRRGLWAMLAVTGPGGVLIFQWQGLSLLLVLLLLFWVYRRALMQRLGGYSGDGAGALLEISELAVLLVAAVPFNA